MSTMKKSHLFHFCDTQNYFSYLVSVSPFQGETRFSLRDGNDFSLSSSPPLLYCLALSMIIRAKPDESSLKIIYLERRFYKMSFL
jgi:hypothetical protein